MNIVLHFADPRNHLFGNYIDFFQHYTKEDLKRDIKACKGIVVPEEATIYAYGFRKKPIVLLIDNEMRSCKILIRRYLLLYGANQREYIYLYPSCVVKYCPFLLDMVEEIYTENIRTGKDPIEGLEDPKNLLESSEPLQRWVNRLERRIDKSACIAHLAARYTSLFSRLPETMQSFVKPSVLEEWLHLLCQFTQQLGITLRACEAFSYGNYIYPL